MPTINGLDLIISLDSNGVITARIDYTLEFSQEEVTANIAVAERAVLARRYGARDAYTAQAASAAAGMQLLASQTASDPADQVVAVLQDATANYDSFGVAAGAPASVPRSFTHTFSEQERTALLEVGREHPYALVSVLPTGIRADVQIAQVEIDVGDPAAAPQAGGDFVVGSAPRAVAFDGQSVWVTNSGSNDVTRLGLGGSPLGTYRVGTGPAAIVFEGSTSTIWVASSDGMISVFSPAGTLAAEVFTAGPPNALAAGDGNIWVAINGGTLTKLSPNGVTQGTFALPGRAPSAIAVGGDSVWVADESDATVTRLRAADGSLVGTYPVGTQPVALAFDGDSMWVANFGDSTVTKLRAADGVSLGSFPVGLNPIAIATANGMAWVANSGGSTVTRLRTSDGSIDETIDVGPGPGSIAYDGQNIWVTIETRNTVASRQA